MWGNGVIKHTFEETLTGLIAPVVEGLGLQLWGVEVLSGSGRRLLRIYVDGENGVTIDQCATVSRDLGLTFDVEDVIPGAYVLEVSSPGLERRFFHPSQMAAYVGRELDVRLTGLTGDRRSHKGRLTAVDAEGEAFDIEENGEPVRLTWDQVKKAVLVHDFEG